MPRGKPFSFQSKHLSFNPMSDLGANFLCMNQSLYICLSLEFGNVERTYAPSTPQTPHYDPSPHSQQLPLSYSPEKWHLSQQCSHLRQAIPYRNANITIFGDVCYNSTKLNTTSLSQQPQNFVDVTQNISHRGLFLTYLMSMLEICSSHYFLETLIIFTCVRIQVYIQCCLYFTCTT